MDKPGVKRLGPLTADNERAVAGVVEKVGHILRAQLPPDQKEHLHSVFSNYFCDMVIGKPLKATRKQLETVEALSSKLLDALEAIKENPSAMEALAGTDHNMSDLIPDLERLRGCTADAAGELPKTGRWGVVSREADLVRDLAVFYESYTGEPAKTGINHDRESDIKYTGSFFNLIYEVFEYLNISHPVNASFGKYILSHLPK